MSVARFEVAACSVEFRRDDGEVADRLEVSDGAAESQRMISEAKATLGGPCGRGSTGVSASLFIIKRVFALIEQT